MVSGGPSWKETRRPPWPCGREGVGLKRSGFAKGRLDRRCGAVSVSDGASSEDWIAHTFLVSQL